MSKCVIAFLAIGAHAISASASIIGVSGQVQQIAAPSDARLNVLTSAEFIRAWDERQRVVLDVALRVGATASGKYDAAADLAPALLAAGTMVSSHYIHFDSPGSDPAAAAGRIFFDTEILGVICVGDTRDAHDLGDSDYLSAGTIYSTGVGNRGLELKPKEFFEISADRRSVSVSFHISHPGDYIRVITAVPMPGTATLAGAGLLLIGRRRR